MTATISAREIRDAGGLAKWTRKASVRLPRNNAVGYAAERMNKLESRYAAHLESQKKAGTIVLWRYEEVKFRLADRTWYTPDFYIITATGEVEIHETKGFMQEDANVKIKSVAEKFPELTFVLVREKKGQWEFHKYGRPKS